MINFEDIQYLLAGNEGQRRVHDVLTRSRIMEQLNGFTPVFVGSIPIDVHVGDSDLDIICCYADQKAFEDVLKSRYGGQEAFNMRESESYGVPAVVCNFTMYGFLFEVFGQPLPVKQQMAYRHMIIEHQLLLQYGEPLRAFVVDQKSKGAKTEPAFCKWLGMEGDPYLELLKLERNVAANPT